MKISYEDAFIQIKDKQPDKSHALIGFDAVVDYIMKVIKQRDENGNEILFSTIGEFGEYLCTKKGMSCGLQLKTVTRKIGGNMAIMAQAMSKIGIQTSCIGTIGEEHSDLYKALSEFCDVYSIAPYGNSTALEFEDGKVMLADNSPLGITWNDIITNVGEQKLENLLCNSKLLCLVNWSELPNASEIWGTLFDFISKHNIGNIDTVFFDLADISHRSSSEVKECISIIAKYNDCAKTVLGLNENEARILANTYATPATSINDIGKILQNKIQVSELIIHTNTAAYAFDAGGECYESTAFICKNPAVLTGGGDNFNAGYCLGILMGLDIGCRLLLANALSGYYVRNGESVSFDKLKEFIGDNLYTNK